MTPKVIAICGYIGSGKSQVAAILRQWGYKTVDCDRLARQIADEPEVVRQAAALLGDGYVVNGKLNRPLIRERVFADPKLLDKYQMLFFDKVRARLVELAEQSSDVLFVEIPVLDAFDFPWNEIWCVVSDREKLVERVQKRDGVTAQSVSVTLSWQKKCTSATNTIFNNGDLSALENAVRGALISSGINQSE